MSIATTVMRMKLWHYEELECLARRISLNRVCFNTPDWKVSVVEQGVCTTLTVQVSTRQIRAWQCFILRLNKRKLNLSFIVKHALKVFFSSSSFFPTSILQWCTSSKLLRRDFSSSSPLLWRLFLPQSIQFLHLCCRPTQGVFYSFSAQQFSHCSKGKSSPSFQQFLQQAE